MKKYCVFGLILLFSACTPSSQDADFKSFIKSFHQSKWKQFPLWAAKDGYKEFDKILPIPDLKKLEADLQFFKKYRDSLLVFDPKRLSAPFQFEYNKIKPFLTNSIHEFETLKIHENDPTYYDLREVFYTVLKAENTSDDALFEALESKLKRVPEYYSAAKANLKTPDQSKMEEAMQQQIELYNFLDGQIAELFQSSRLPQSKLTNLEHLKFEAQLNIKDFIAFCQSAAFEHLDAALNATPAPSTKEEFEKIFTNKK